MARAAGRFALWSGALLLSLAVRADPGLPVVAPEQVGMSAERLERITELNRRYVSEGKLAGSVTLVARDGKVVYLDAQGVAHLESGAPMQPDTLVRIYSMSKPITAVAAMILYEEGAFQLRDPITRFLPELADLQVLQQDGTYARAGAITMQQLLTHTAGFSYGFDAADPVDQRYRESRLLTGSQDLTAFVQTLGQLPLRFEPGSRWHYSVAVDVTGAIIERISGQRLDVFLRQRVFAPLGMHDTFFEVPDEKLARFGTNHRWNPETRKLEILPDPEYPRWRNTTFFSGGGGLVSTIDDYARFAEMLRAGGTFDGVRILGPKTVELMTMNHLPALLAASGSGERPGLGRPDEYTGAGFGLGFAVLQDIPAGGVVGSKGQFSWGGAAGTIFWVDPVEELVVISMIQLMQSPWPLREELQTLTYQALTELR